METAPDLAKSVASLPWTQDGLSDDEQGVLQLLNTLAIMDSELAARVVRLLWLSDDITYWEWRALEEFALAAEKNVEAAKFVVDMQMMETNRTLAAEVASLPWPQGGITDESQIMLEELDILAWRDAGLARQVVGVFRVAGDISEDEWLAVRALIPKRLDSLTRGTGGRSGDDERLRSMVQALELAGSLSEGEGLGPLKGELTLKRLRTMRGYNADLIREIVVLFELADNVKLEDNMTEYQFLTPEARASIAELSEEDKRFVTSLEWVRDGVTEEEYHILSKAHWIASRHPDLMDTLLDPEQVMLETRTIELPLSGEVRLTIIRTRPGVERTIELLEKSVRIIEEFMGVPFPQTRVDYLFHSGAVPPSYGGTNYRTHIGSLPYVDSAGYDAEDALLHIAHEVAHYYWRGNESWINEGGAVFLESVVKNADRRRKIFSMEPCPHALNISELVALLPGLDNPKWHCTYSLGGGLFFDLHRNMSEDTFRKAFRNLYLKSQVADEWEPGSISLTIGHVRSAFAEAAPPEKVDKVKEVIEHWYSGSP